MEWLNYHHLLYFWTVAREGSVSRAAEKLRLSQPTISAQIRLLEQAIGERLFHRQGRQLAMTDVGRMVYRYADEIFTIGGELLETMRGRPTGRPLQLTVGVANAVPKLIAYQLLRPAFEAREPIHVVCHEDNAEQLATELATHALDVVIADTPAPPHIRVKVFNHRLGESDTMFFAPPALATRLRRKFPKSLANVAMLVPTTNSALRRELDAWLQKEDVRPLIRGEFEDSALMKAVAQGMGAVFPAPAVIADEVCQLYDVRVVGRTSAVRERYFAISVERRLTHPGVMAITASARAGLFR